MTVCYPTVGVWPRGHRQSQQGEGRVGSIDTYTVLNVCLTFLPKPKYTLEQSNRLICGSKEFLSKAYK